MKRLVIVSAIFMCALCLYAQNNAARNRGVIAVYQYFHGWTHCHADGKPTFGSCNITSYEAQIYCNLTSSKDKDTIAIAQMFSSESGVIYLDKEKTKRLELKIVHDASHIDDSKCEYTMNELHIGANRTDTKEKKDHCIGSKDEGYDVYTDVTVDNPIEIKNKKDNSSLSIDDNEKCELLLNDFYVTATTEFYLSVKLTSEGDDSWHKVERKFKSKQEIAFSYAEIRSIAGITDPFAWSGKNISIKITKKLIDGSWSESNVVLCTFIHKGPDFEIETVRRTNCSDKVELMVKSEQLSDYLGKGKKFNWEVKEKKSGIFADVDTFEFAYMPDVYKLKLKADDAFYTRINEYEKIEPDKEHPWLLQLQEKEGEQEKDSSVAYFTTKEFEIAPRAPQIKIEQYTNAGTEVESGLNPYIRIKIEDLDTYYDNGRVPYKVYEVDENENEYYLTEFNNRITTEYNEAQLKSIFNSQYPRFSWNITMDSFRRSKFHEWYESKGNGPAVKTIKQSSFTPATGNLGQITSQANVLCETGKELYYYSNGSWERIDFSESASYPLNEQKTNTSIDNKPYRIYDIKSQATTFNGYTKNEFITQSSDFIVFRFPAVVHILFFSNSSVTHVTGSPASSSSSYLASTKEGKPCLVYYEGKGGIFSYYEDGKLVNVSLYNQPDGIDKIRINADNITYVSGKQCYKQKETAFSENTLYTYFTNNQAVIANTYFDSDWVKFQEERKKEYAQFLAEKLSYKASGLKYFTEDKTNGDVVTCTGKLKIQEYDSCYSNVIDYTFQYRKVKFDVKVTKYPTSASANDGQVRLTLIEGGLAPYTINGKSLKKNELVEIDGCGYGETKVNVKDGKGVEFDYTIEINIPNHKIVSMPQNCSGRGGEIVVTCDENDLKLKGYFIKQNGSIVEKIYSTSNNCTFSGLALGDYEVWGEFDNGDQILLSEKETIVDNSLSVTAVVDNATKIGEKGEIELKTQNAQGNVVWQEITENGEIGIDGKDSSISIKDVSIGRHKYRVSDSQVCSVTTTVEVSGPEISMDVDIEADGKSAYVKIEDIKSQNISNYRFEVNGEKVENFSNISYDSSDDFILDLKYQTTPQGEVYTYNIIDQKLNSGTISISDASDKERCSGTDGQLKIVAENIPENVKCYYQIANVSEGETELTNGTHDVNASIGEKVVYVRQDQTFSKGQINVNIHHDSQHSVIIADGTPTEAIVIAHDVKCKGANDGYIEILTENGESPQNVWLKISTNVSSENKTLIPDLRAGIYECYVVDGRCPTLQQKHTATINSPIYPLQLDVTQIYHPSCGIDDGEISVEVSGGWSERYKVLTDAAFANDLLNDETGYSDEMQHTFKNLTGGQHTIYVADAGGCVSSVSTILNDHAQNVDYKLSIADVSCFDFVDGSVSIAGIKGFNTVNYTLTKANEVIAQEDVSFDDDNILINNTLRAGNDYCLTLRNDDGCIGSDRFYINQPPKIELDLGHDVTICPNNVVQLDAGNHQSYQWQCAKENISNDRSLIVNKSGIYSVVVTDENGCQATDTISVEIGNSALQAYFLMSSDAQLGDTIVIVELSNMRPDNIEWDYDTASFTDVTPTDAADYLFYLLPNELGTYNITMNAYANGCISSDTKQISIVENIDQYDNFELGYAPLIKQAKVSPNPNDGEFDLIVVLREKADVDVMVHDVNNGRQVEHVVLKDSDKYNTRLNIRQWGSGIFVLSVVSGTERRAIKVLCVR